METTRIMLIIDDDSIVRDSIPSEVFGEVGKMAYTLTDLPDSSWGIELYSTAEYGAREFVSDRLPDPEPTEVKPFVTEARKYKFK